MCGRYAASRRPEDLTVEFEAVVAGGQSPLPADYNVAPTKDVYVVRHKKERDAEGAPTGGGHRELRAVRWGLVPSWAKDVSVGNRMLNARVESLTDKPAFKKAAATRRCLVPADGWYEWLKPETPKGDKIPFRYTVDGGGPFAFAGLWRRNRIAGELVLSACILTTAANSVCAPVHDRMPCVLAGPDEEAAWLAGESEGLLGPFAAERTTVAPANPAVNKAGVEGEELLVAPPEPTQLRLT
jgi:putative SOS response-associated peptidase YedK